MKKNVKLIATLAAFVMLLSALTACGGSPSDSSQSPSPSPSAPASTAPESKAPESAAPATPEAPTGEEIDLPDVPAEFTKAKLYTSDYGFGTVDVTMCANSDETKFYITFFAFDEDQRLEGTVADGVFTSTFDLTGFMAKDAQRIYDDSLTNDSPWQPIKGHDGTGAAAPTGEEIELPDVPAEFTKAKLYTSDYGFGMVDVTMCANDDETKFYITFFAFDEEQRLEGTVADGVFTTTFDLTGFMAKDAQRIYDDSLTSDSPWQPIKARA